MDLQRSVMCARVLKGIWIARTIAVLKMGGNITSCPGTKDKLRPQRYISGRIRVKTGKKLSAVFYITTS
jgi:hypothetical protein